MTATSKIKSVKKTSSEAPVAVAAQTKGKTKNPANLKLVGGTDFQNQFRDLPLNLVEPGENWRKEFDSPEFDLFVENIRENGVLETILVTPIAGSEKFKIIAGERRYRASTKAGLPSIPARVLNLSDEKLMDAHIAENLQRKDLKPMEEAEGLLLLVKQAETRKITLSTHELARRVGKPAEHVALRLELNKLFPEAKQDLRDGYLDVTVAERIAPFSDAQQREIYGFCFDTEWKKGKQVLDKTQPRTLRSINEKIASQILLDLQYAPFSRTATDLRADKLPCTDCKQRTGSADLLFAEMNAAKKDCCMNRECYTGKLKKHVELVQITIARKNIEKTLPKPKKGEKLPEIQQKQIKAEIERLPKLTTDWYSSDENLVSRQNYTEIKKAKESCESAITGIFYKGERVGQTQLVCVRSSKCQTHYRTYESSSTKNVNSGDDYKKNRQQLFDLRADQKTRRKVLTEAVAQFDENKTVWGDEKLRLLMLASMIKSIGYNERHRRTLIAEILGLEEKTLDNDTHGATDFQIFEIYEKLTKVSEAVQSKLFFLMTVASFGENQYETRGIKQTLVESLAEHLGINYNLLGAEARVDLCAEKYKKQLPEAKAHLEKAQKSSEPIAFPSFFFDFEAEKKAADEKAATENAEAESIETKIESDELVAA